MLTLREPFIRKVHLHIRQDMLRRLWDKYVPASSPEYGQIELVYRKDAPGDMGKQPEQIQLLLHLLLKMKKLQINLVQYPALMKIGQKQMESSLQRMEQYYALQLKCSDLAMYRTVRQYFTLLKQAEEDGRRYQGWQKNHQEIERQKDEYRLLSLFSEKLQNELTEYSVSRLRTMEREFVDSLSDTEYGMLAEALIWQEKTELIEYFKGRETTQCKEIVKKLKKDADMGQLLASLQNQSPKKKLVAAADKLEQKEFSPFYWQVVDLEDVNPQMIIWKRSKTEMLRSIDEMGSESLQKVWAQMETVGSVKENKHVFSEKMLHLRNRYQRNESKNLQKRIAVMLKENALEGIADIVDMEQLMQDISMIEYTEKSEGDTGEPEFLFRESEQLVLRDGAYQVIRNLEREQEIRRERIEQQQAQAVETYQNAYHQIVRTESIPVRQQENIAQSSERIFRKQDQEQLAEEDDKQESVGELLQNGDKQLLNVSYRSLWEWGETLLFHSEHQQEWEDADILAAPKPEELLSDETNQDEIQTQLIRRQIEMAKDRNRLQRLIRQVNHQADIQLVYTDTQLRMPQVQALLQYIQELDEKQYGAFVKEFVQILKLRKRSDEEPEAASVYTGEENHPSVARAATLEQRVISYPTLERYIQDYEEQHQSELHRNIRKIEKIIFPQAYAVENRQYAANSSVAGSDAQVTAEAAAYDFVSYEAGIHKYDLMSYDTYGADIREYGVVPYETYGTDIREYGMTSYETHEDIEKEYVQLASTERHYQENGYQPQKLEYSVQKASASEEAQQRKELRMQQENARMKSEQEQLVKKLKEVENQLKKVEDSTKAKEDVRSFSEQVKQQLYEELHVEKLRRGLI